MTGKIFVLVAALAGACATAPQQSPGGGDLSDGEIAAIVETASEGEIRQSEVARSRASSAEVRAFAEMMVMDHTSTLTRARDVFSRERITPADNDLSMQLRTGGQRTAEALGTYSGAALDREYMKTQIDVHDWLLRTIDSTLIPSAGSTQLLRFLREQRTSVATHLERARQIQRGLG